MHERNYGIDFLRILSMFFIVILHILGHGGILAASSAGSVTHGVAWCMEIIAYCAVNCYALISGFVMYKSTAKFSRIFKLWLQVIFYSLVISAVVMIIHPEALCSENILNMLFPVTRVQYWYISAYFGMYLFIPVLNIAINTLPQKSFATMLLCMFVLMSVIPTALSGDPYSLAGGYSCVWLCILYLTGGYFSKYDTLNKLSAKVCCVVFAVAIITTLAVKLLTSSRVFVSYVSPTIVIAAVSLMGLALKIKYSDIAKKVIAFLAPATLGVYLIHTHPLVWEKVFVNGCTAKWVDMNAWLMALVVLAAAIATYLICTLIDRGRILLFKLLKTDALCTKTEERSSAFKEQLFEGAQK